MRLTNQRRRVNETQSRVKWLGDKVAEVDRSIEEGMPKLLTLQSALLTVSVHARITLRRQSLAERRARLESAEIADHLLHSRLSDLSTEIHTAEYVSPGSSLRNVHHFSVPRAHSYISQIRSHTDLLPRNDRSSLIPAIHHTRSQHVQALDALFPISPLHPPSLLYSILDIPLPIPLGPKDPAPPLTMTLPKDLHHLPVKGKVDEKSTAAALGYVGLLVQILGNLSGVRKEGGLSYPITCAGSRSLVKDTVSIMQGPRSSVSSLLPPYLSSVGRGCGDGD